MRMCQSCGMPIKKDEVKGTEKDGRLSQDYCHLCYKDGQFCDPNISLEEMQTKAIEGMQKAGFPKFFARHIAKRQIPKLRCWQS